MRFADEAVLERARLGDREAIEALLATHQPHLRRFAHRMCRTREDADDAVQHAMVQLTQHADEFRGAGKLASWFFTIIKRECMRLFALARRDGELEAQYDRLDRARDPELLLALERSLGALEPELREVLLLRDVQEFTGPEVAQMLDITLEAMKSRLHRARLSMRQALGMPDEARS